MFKVHLLPAEQGDCLWIDYGTRATRHRILIDGGVVKTYGQLRARIAALPANDRHFELLVITHIDLDHIAGILDLLRDPPQGVTFGDVWFNGWRELVAASGEDPDDGGVLGARLGERVSAWLVERRYHWNRAFDRRPVAIGDDAGALPTKSLPGGMKLTLLAPTYARLGRLRPEWEKDIREAGLRPGEAGPVLEDLVGHPDEEVDDGVLGENDGTVGPETDIGAIAEHDFGEDSSRANGSSIALLAEYDGKRCLLAGDSYASDIGSVIIRIAEARREDRLRVDAMKLSHHGGRKNTSNELLDLIECPRFLLSTSGKIYKHPHRESVARAIVHGNRAAGQRGPELFFNYRSERTMMWNNEALSRGALPYRPRYPTGEDGITVEL